MSVVVVACTRTEVGALLEPSPVRTRRASIPPRRGSTQTPRPTSVVCAASHASASAVDPTTNAVYVTNLYDASVSVIDGAICKGVVSFGCRLVPPKLPTDHFPASIAIDPAVGTAYVHNEGSISVVPLLR